MTTGRWKRLDTRMGRVHLIVDFNTYVFLSLVHLIDEFSRLRCSHLLDKFLKGGYFVFIQHGLLGLDSLRKCLKEFKQKLSIMRKFDVFTTMPANVPV